MSELFIVVNQDTKEYFSPHALGSGAKIREIQLSPNWVPMALFHLLTAQGFGTHEFTGRWAGDRIAIVGDEYDDLFPDAKSLNVTALNEYTDIGPIVKDWLGTIHADIQWAAVTP